MTEAPNFRTGEMPNTDFKYEEFEGFLASYYLSLLPLKDGDEQDKADFQSVVNALTALAQSQGVQTPEIASTQPRPTTEPWGQPEAYPTPSMLLDSFRAFYSDFGVGMEPQTPDGEQRIKLGQVILGVLDRHGVITTASIETEGKKYTRITHRNQELLSKPLQEVLKPVV